MIKIGEKIKMKRKLDKCLLLIYFLVIPLLFFDWVLGQYQLYQWFIYGIIPVIGLITLYMIIQLKPHLSSKHFGYLCQLFVINLFVVISLIVLKHNAENRTAFAIGLALVSLLLFIYGFVLEYRLNRVFDK